MSAACNSCGAPVLWASSWKSGAPMALNTQPLARSESTPKDIVLVKGREGPIAVQVYRFDGIESLAFLLDNAERFRVHFATCPNAATHRRR